MSVACLSLARTLNLCDRFFRDVAYARLFLRPRLWRGGRRRRFSLRWSWWRITKSRSVPRHNCTRDLESRPAMLPDFPQMQRFQRIPTFGKAQEENTKKNRESFAPSIRSRHIYRCARVALRIVKQLPIRPLLSQRESILSRWAERKPMLMRRTVHTRSAISSGGWPCSHLLGVNSTAP